MHVLDTHARAHHRVSLRVLLIIGAGSGGGGGGGGGGAGGHSCDKLVNFNDTNTV